MDGGCVVREEDGGRWGGVGEGEVQMEEGEEEWMREDGLHGGGGFGGRYVETLKKTVCD